MRNLSMTNKANKKSATKKKLANLNALVITKLLTMPMIAFEAKKVLNNAYQ